MSTNTVRNSNRPAISFITIVVEPNSWLEMRGEDGKPAPRPMFPYKDIPPSYPVRITDGHAASAAMIIGNRTAGARGTGPTPAAAKASMVHNMLEHPEFEGLSFGEVARSVEARLQHIARARDPKIVELAA